jgi:SAM-dependent methyltransferase
MNTKLRDRLAALPALNDAPAHAETAQCKLCASQASLFDVLDLQKHCAFDNPYKFGLSGVQVPYLRCESCGFLFTCFFDDWRPQDWARFIYNDDYIKVDPDYSGARAVRMAEAMAGSLDGCQHLRILDYGAGAGVFVARMRDAGFTRIEGYDPYSSPEKPAGLFDIVTCLEVLEHTPDPIAAIADIHAMLAASGGLIFSQSLQPANIAEMRGAWWYVAPRNGHVSTFTIDALTRLLPSPAHRLHGKDPLWAMIPRDVNPAIAAALPRIGPAVRSHRLTAPVHGRDDQFHAAEQGSAGMFRWSRTAELRWVLPGFAAYPARLDVHVPFALEITNGFAAGCKLRINGVAAETRCGRAGIAAQTRIDRAPDDAAADIVVTLQTPAPCSPFDLRGVPDGRALGLAILAA